MKHILLFTLLSIVAVSCTPPKTPTVCQRNLKDCTEAYDEGKDVLCRMKGPDHCSRAAWDTLCKQDLNLCKENWGM